MPSNLFLYLTAMSAVSIHNLVNNINEATQSVGKVELRTSATNWTLDNPRKLVRTFPECNGTRQSPININTSLVKENLNLRLSLTAYDKPISGLLTNQFPSFRLAPTGFEWPRPNSVISNSLARSFNPYADSHFVLQYVQFFWNSEKDEDSSLHRINGIGYPLEIHFVHMNTIFTSLEEAFRKPEGLLILSAMAVPSTHESYLFDRILDELANITKPAQQVAIEEDSTWRSLLPADTSRFYRYQGSMILPPCHESVQWIVFEEKLKLGLRQLKRMRRYMFLGRDLSNGNNRDIDWTSQRRVLQNLNNRNVERSFSLNSNLPKSSTRNSSQARQGV